MTTTIQISDDLQEFLNKRKLYSKETYEEVIWDIVEDTRELSEETKKKIAESIKDVEEGRVYSLDEAKKMMGL